MKRRTFFMIVSISMAIAVLTQRGLSSRIEQFVGWCAYPFIMLTHRIAQPIEQWRERRNTLEEVRKALLQIQHEKDVLQSELTAVRGIQLHALQRDELVQWSLRYKATQLHTARVIGRLCSDGMQHIFLDAGSRVGVTVDMIVVLHNNLVGRVSAVYPSWCRVITITDRTSKVPIVCARTGTRAIYEGLNLPDRARLSFVSHLHPLERGDILLSSGDGFVYPEGFAVGRVREFVLDKRGLHYDVEVEPLIDPTVIQLCCIIDKDSTIKSITDDFDISQTHDTIGSVYDATASSTASVAA